MYIIIYIRVCTGDSFLGTSVSPAVTPTKKIPPSIEEQPSQLTRQKAGLELEKSEFYNYYTCTCFVQ